ncbi:hypothetical protein [Myxococcus sp. AM010]|uniref:hypothetical protein n=2 Tax=unclassified Myxococcus TaxID=2648731 RepID=UPI0020CBFCA5|nr:hypothetical protein [Myxococcus sp. AM010]
MNEVGTMRMKLKQQWVAAACAAVVGGSGVANAHDLICKKKVNGASVVVADEYPYTANYSFKVINVHPTLPSVLLTATDDVLSSEGFTFSPPPPVSIPVNGSLTSEFALQIGSYEECVAIAAEDGLADNHIDNTFRVTFDLGSAMCSARLTCEREEPPPVECTSATRTLGFFSTRILSLTQCLALGPIDLGPIGTIVTLPAAEGILWGSPAMYPAGGVRSQLDRLRFLLARQTLVGVCNQRLFGSTPTPPSLLTDAVAALNTTDCGLISSLIDPVDNFNNQCDSYPLPGNFIPGPATPQAAQAIAVDPTSNSGQSCSP